MSEFSKKIVWKDPSQLPLSYQEINQFQNVLNSRSVYFSDAQDQIFWAPAKDGKDSVKEGYKILQQKDFYKPTSRVFVFCWHSVVLPKAGCFAWLALKHRILTSDRLDRL